MIPGVSSFVWQDPPGGDAPHVTHWLIKAANGDGHTAPGGFDFAANYGRWASAKGESACSGWTWLYDTTDGATAARQLVAAAPNAASYGADVEGDDANVSPNTDRARLGRIVADFVPTLRKLRPNTPVWFTSYPDRAQAIAHGAPWDTLISLCDFGVPQVYFPSQGGRWQQIIADHRGKPVLAAFSPGDWQGWANLAEIAATRFGGIALWRYPMSKQWTHAIADLAALTNNPGDEVTPQDIAAIADAVWNQPLDDPFHGGKGTVPARRLLRGAAQDGAAVLNAVQAVAAQHGLDPAAFAAAVTAELAKRLAS